MIHEHEDRERERKKPGSKERQADKAGANSLDFVRHRGNVATGLYILFESTNSVFVLVHLLHYMV